METLAGFIRRATGKRCCLYFAKRKNAYYAQWSSKEAAEVTIRETERILRTENKTKNYARAREVLPTIMTEKEQRRMAAERGREVLRKKRLLKALENAQ